jgi:hypothetical protein
MNFQDDELDVISPKTDQSPATATATATATAPATTKPAIIEEDTDVEFGDEKITSFSDGLDKVNPDKGKTIRFSLLTDIIKAKAAYTHYIETGDRKGTYRCLRSVKAPASEVPGCCTKVGESYLYVVAIVLLYTNADQKGALPKDTPIEWKIGYVRLGRGVFRTISELVNEDTEEGQAKAEVHNLDIRMTRLANNKFEVKRLNKNALWRRNPQLVIEVKAALAPFADGKKLETKLGRKLDNLGWKALFASLTGGNAAEASLENVDDL